MYTWTCTSCPARSEQDWPDPQDAAAAGAAHGAVCAAGGQAVVIARADPHPEQLGAAHRLGNYDRDEPLLVPAWVVLVARSAVGRLGLLARGRAALPLDFADPDEVLLWSRVLTVANPRPDRPAPQTRDEIATLLDEVRAALNAALPSL